MQGFTEQVKLLDSSASETTARSTANHVFEILSFHNQALGMHLSEFAAGIKAGLIPTSQSPSTFLGQSGAAACDWRARLRRAVVQTM